MMGNNLIGRYKNGNYTVTLFKDGTKIRANNLNNLTPEFPESMDMKITDYCDMNCPYCHENSTVNGKHGDILNIPFLDSIRPHTEIAIGGGNPLSHPDLVEFLKILKSRKIVANVTVNQKHLLDNLDYIRGLCEDKLIYGLGVSVTSVTPELVEGLKCISHAVLHVINGVITIDELNKLRDVKNSKILILGYKQFRRGIDFFSNDVAKKMSDLFDNLPLITSWFEFVSFDNLALKQLDVKRLMSEDEWNSFYMGDDGNFTMYVDMVKRKYSKSSTCLDRNDVLDDIVKMFEEVNDGLQKEDK